MSSKMKALSKRRPRHNIISMILGSVKEKNRHGSTSGGAPSSSSGRRSRDPSSSREEGGGNRGGGGEHDDRGEKSSSRSSSSRPTSRTYDSSRKNRILATAVELTRRTKSRYSRESSSRTSSSGGITSSIRGVGGGSGSGKGSKQFYKGQRAYYRSTRGISKVTIVGIHHDSKLEAYYTIKLKDGKEKQTDGKHLTPVAEEPSSSSSGGGRQVHASSTSGSGGLNNSGKEGGGGQSSSNNQGHGSSSRGKSSSHQGPEVMTDHMSTSSSEGEGVVVDAREVVRERPALPAPPVGGGEDSHSRSSGSDHDNHTLGSGYRVSSSTNSKMRGSSVPQTPAASATPASSSSSTPGKEPDEPPFRKHQEAYYRDEVFDPSAGGLTKIVTKVKILEIYTDLNNKLFKHSYSVELQDGSQKEVRGNKLATLMELSSEELAEVMKEKNSRQSGAGGSGGSVSGHSMVEPPSSKREEIRSGLSRRGSLPDIHKNRGGKEKLNRSLQKEPLTLPSSAEETIDEGYEAEEGPFSSGSENSDSSNELHDAKNNNPGDNNNNDSGNAKNNNNNNTNPVLALPSPVQMVQANTEDGGTKMVPRYDSGTDLFYRGPQGIVKAHILDSHLDDLLEPYYTVRLEDGREKQTDNAHLQLTRDAPPIMEQAIFKAGDDDANQDCGGGENGSEEGGVDDEQTLLDPEQSSALVPASKINTAAEEKHSSDHHHHELVPVKKQQDPSATNIGALVKFSIGEEVQYNSSQGEHLRATVLKLLKDKKNRPYYVVRLQGGKEKQVYGHRLSPCPKPDGAGSSNGASRCSGRSPKRDQNQLVPRSRSISRSRRSTSGTNDTGSRSYARSNSIDSRSSRRSSSSRSSRDRSAEPTSSSARERSNSRSQSLARRSRSKSVRGRRGDLDSSNHGPDRGQSISRRSRSRAPSEGNLASSTGTRPDRRPTTPGISHSSRIIYPPEEGGSSSREKAKLGGFRKSFSVGRSKQ